MNFIKKYYLVLILLVSIGLWFYVQSIKKAPCEVTLNYTIGTIDPRFNLSAKEFAADLAQATSVWEKSYGKDLFQYKVNGGDKPNLLQKYIGRYFTRGDITVSLIYDERQKLAIQNNILSTQVDETKQSADAVKAQFSALQAQYKQSAAEYQSLLASYKQSHGNSSQGSYQDLEAKRLEVNSLADQVNVLIKKYNYLVTATNSTIRTINQSAGQEFEEGKYISDSKGERIIIYEFSSKDILIRVLAHELGHSLGLDHNDNPNSIMYYLNQSENMTPTSQDLGALKAICKGK